MTKKEILIVEDEYVVGTDIEMMLGNLGYDVVDIVASGEEAISIARKKHIDLMLMDIRLDGHLDGIQTAEIIRSVNDIPVIYLTSYSDEQTIKRAATTEPHGYVLKPFNEKELQTIIEITLYKHKMERQLKEQKLWLSTILKSIADAIIVVDSTGSIGFANQEAQKLIGLTFSQIQGLQIDDVFTLLDENTRLPINLADASDDTDSDPILGKKKTMILHPKLAPEVFIELGMTFYRRLDDTIDGFVIIFRNISEKKKTELKLQSVIEARKKAEHELRQSEKLINDIISSVPVGTIILDILTEKILLINEKSSEILRTMELSVDYKTLSDRFYKPHSSEIGQNIRYEIRKNHQIFGYSLYLVGEEFLCIYIRDISEEMRLESIASSINVMENINIIFSSIRHEIGNPLNVLKTTLSVFQQKYDQFGQEKRNIYFNRLNLAITNIEELLSQLRTYHVFQDLPLSSINIVSILHDCIEQLQDQCQPNKTIMVFHTDNETCLVNANKQGLQQVFINVLKNALEAVENVEEPQVVITLSKLKKRVLVLISDNGCGIEEKDLKNIFTPLFTRKPHGTGLGLAIVKKIITQCHGSIEIENSEEKGAIAKITLELID